MSYMKTPSIDELKGISEEYGFALSEEELRVIKEYIDRSIAPSYAWLDQMPEPKPEVRYPRLIGRRPRSEENRYGAWAWLCRIKGSEEGILAGKKLAIKDNVAVAGVPMLNGSALLEGFIPDIDAAIVTRILDAGGEILGKATCENLCISGGSHTSYPWPVLNPHNTSYMAGGSSSGSAVLVATGEVDMAIGGDQGGSIRIPSSWCGIYGLKPTWGLVPYTGIFPIELTLDHTGPMARSVRDIALLLEVVAGRDGLDPRQELANTPTSLPSYSKALTGDIEGLRIGVVKEGFGWSVSEPDVDELVMAEAQRFKELGAAVEEVSIPLHRRGIDLWTGVIIEGLWSMMVLGEGVGHLWLGYYDTHLVEFYGRSRRVRARDFSPTVKMSALLGHYLWDKYHSRYYAKAQNLRRELRAAYDDALQKFDILLMPTTPQKAQPFKDQEDLMGYITSALNMAHNTAPFDVSGHPAINVPCGKSRGLPVGMMLVGRRFDEATVLNAAYAYERLSQK